MLIGKRGNFLTSTISIFIFLFTSLRSFSLSAKSKVLPEYIQASVWVHAELLALVNEDDIRWFLGNYTEESISELTAEEKLQIAVLLSLFKEVQWILSGMIYGFWFEYVPSFRLRGVEEDFILQHINLIQLGDPNLRLTSIAKNAHWMNLTFEYALSSVQQRRMHIRYDSGIVHARGIADSELFWGFDSRRIALIASIKNAILQKMRILYRSRPQKISGELFLRYPAQISIESGMWRAITDVAMHNKEIIFYSL